MKKILIFFCCVLLTFPCFAQFISRDTIYSTHTKDKYVITIRKPWGFSSKKTFHHVYMTDGSLGIGDYVLGKSDSWKADVPKSCIIIAISHIGDWHEKRNRDFIPGELAKNATENFGKANLFYLFMQTELIPWVEKKLPQKKDRSFIGHSLSGLFCLYTLFKDDKLFDHHFAISPSVWANHYELIDIEEAYAKKTTKLNANVVIYVGGLEFLNKVLSSSRQLYNTMLGRKYVGLNITKKEFADANHFSVRKPAVDKIFEILKD